MPRCVLSLPVSSTISYARGPIYMTFVVHTPYKPFLTLVNALQTHFHHQKALSPHALAPLSPSSTLTSSLLLALTARTHHNYSPHSSKSLSQVLPKPKPDSVLSDQRPLCNSPSHTPQQPLSPPLSLATAPDLVLTLPPHHDHHHSNNVLVPSTRDSPRSIASPPLTQPRCPHVAPLSALLVTVSHVTVRALSPLLHYHLIRPRSDLYDSR